MTQLVVRRLLVDLETPFARRWNGDDAFRTALFNALSMSFVVGEQYFIDSVRNGLKELKPEDQHRLAAEVAGFVGQEATHRRVHTLFNAQLAAQGFNNWIERQGTKRRTDNAHLNFRVHLAATAATEHFTALLAHWIMRHPEVFDGAEPRLRTLWTWHAAEELEHCGTAFDVYGAASGDHTWRVRVFKYVTLMFISDVTRQTVINLWQDKALFKWRTWSGAWQLLFAKDGMVRGNLQAWRDYLAPGFHPLQQSVEPSRQWLSDNAASFKPV
jgi:uncharacterized protein